jgi:hypothetical protein
LTNLDLAAWHGLTLDHGVIVITPIEWFPAFDMWLGRAVCEANNTRNIGRALLSALAGTPAPREADKHFHPPGLSGVGRH